VLLLSAMSTTPKSDSEAPPKQEDGDQTTVDLKRIIEALQALISPTTLAEPKPTEVGRSSTRYIQFTNLAQVCACQQNTF
jgi:hypothetical protein